MGDSGERIQVEHDSGIPAAKDPLIGIPYRATKLLGKGSTALVYEARPRAGGRRVAVKLLRQHLAASEDAVERMRIEAESLACMHHPNIVRVFDFGRTPEGCPYLVEERLYGRSLFKEILARGPLPAFEATDYVCQLLAALEAVHRLGVIHRDLKLANLFLVRDQLQGTRLLKLVDFGFAKVLRVECGQQRPRPRAVSTGADQFVGTPRYSAPEQAEEGHKLGPAADLYTAGLVLYSLLAGREPFCEIARETDLLMAHIQKELGSPAVHTSQPIAAELEQFLRKAVAKDPVDRFASASAMKAELELLSPRLRLAAGLGSSQPVLAASAAPASERSARSEHATVRLDPAQLTALAAQIAKDVPATVSSSRLGEPLSPPAVASHDGATAALEERASQRQAPPSTGAVAQHFHRWRSPATLGVVLGVLLALAFIVWLVSPGSGAR